MSININTLLNSFNLFCVASGKSNNTTNAYLKDIKIFFAYVNKNYSITKLNQLSCKHIIEFKEHCVLSYKTSTIRRRINSLSVFFKYLISKELITHNLCDGQHVKKPKNDEVPVLTPDQLSLIFNSLDVNDKNYVRNKLILLIFLQTGIRRGELFNLNWENIDLYESKVTISTPNKSSLRREFYINKITCDLLTKMYNLQGKPLANMPVFISNRNNRLSRSRINTIFNKIIIDSGIKTDFPITPHVLRHTFATLLYNNPEFEHDINTLRILMGHSNISTTIDYYVNSTISNSKLNLINSTFDFVS